MGADAEVAGPPERRKAFALLKRKFTPMDTVTEAEMAGSAIVRVTPKVISLIDYTKRLGHTDLVDLRRGRVRRSGRTGAVV